VTAPIAERELVEKPGPPNAPPCRPSFGCARTTKRTDLAGKSKHPVHTAGIAVHANQASIENSTIEEGPEFALNEFRYVPVALALPSQECFQMFGNDSIERILLRVPGPVRHSAAHGATAWNKRVRILPNNRSNNLRCVLAEKSGDAATNSSRLFRFWRLQD
jgi:hypothetical protein